MLNFLSGAVSLFLTCATFEFELEDKAGGIWGVLHTFKALVLVVVVAGAAELWPIWLAKFEFESGVCLVLFSWETSLDRAATITFSCVISVFYCLVVQ